MTGAAKELAWSLIPAYALGATEPDEARLVEQMLANDAEAARELARYQDLSKALLFSTPVATPPPALEARLRAAISAPMAATAVSAAALAARPPANPSPAPAPTHALSKPRHWPRWVAAAAGLAAVLAGGWMIRELAVTRDQQAALAAQVTILQEQQESLTTQLATRDELLASVVAKSGEHYVMEPTVADSAAIAQVAWLEDSSLAVLRATNFPPLAEDYVYQLWLIKDDERVNGGTFQVDSAGCATVIFRPDQSLEEFDGMGITPEPSGGSPGPTAPAVVRAQL
ncbi:MAG: anti-sigma factor [Anaerolineales bacterium]|nr:anti-sigma factor [Anaerolineales bacterium]